MPVAHPTSPLQLDPRNLQYHTGYIPNAIHRAAGFEAFQAVSPPRSNDRIQHAEPPSDPPDILKSGPGRTPEHHPGVGADVHSIAGSIYSPELQNHSTRRASESINPSAVDSEFFSSRTSSTVDSSQLKDAGRFGPFELFNVAEGGMDFSPDATQKFFKSFKNIVATYSAECGKKQIALTMDGLRDYIEHHSTTLTSASFRPVLKESRFWVDLMAFAVRRANANAETKLQMDDDAYVIYVAGPGKHKKRGPLKD
ncbi:hypothetical protein C8R46DRAFT_1125324 [Mycena filopes]|nr:hypothetical protein C8R46DRAFT_1125324 [Mycena filopes]